jgi:glucokinase
MKTNIAIDVGGTQLRAACYPSDSIVPLKLSKISTQSSEATPLERLNDLITSVWPLDEEVASIGLAVPGPTNPYQGIIYTAPNIPGWDNLPLVGLLQEKFNVPVFLGNDANLAALGEWKFGSGRGHHHLLYLTISTGIGGGVILDDRLLLGMHGLATELGHITLDPDGPICSCGKRGHLEALASGTAIARWVEQELTAGKLSSLPANQKLSAREIAAAAQQGDAIAKAAFQRAGTYLGIGLTNYLHAFNPSIIIFGGGVSRSGELLFSPMRAILREQVISPQYLADLTITTASLGDESGLLGALALARSGIL